MARLGAPDAAAGLPEHVWSGAAVGANLAVGQSCRVLKRAPALYALLEPLPYRFSSLLPFIIQWQDELRSRQPTSRTDPA